MATLKEVSAKLDALLDQIALSAPTKPSAPPPPSEPANPTPAPRAKPHDEDEDDDGPGVIEYLFGDPDDE